MCEHSQECDNVVILLGYFGMPDKLCKHGKLKTTLPTTVIVAASQIQTLCEAHIDFLNITTSLSEIKSSCKISFSSITSMPNYQTFGLTSIKTPCHKIISKGKYTTSEVSFEANKIPKDYHGD